MYTHKNYPTKRKLMEDVKNWNFFLETLFHMRGVRIVSRLNEQTQQIEMKRENESEAEWKSALEFLKSIDADTDQTRAFLRTAVTIFAPGLGKPKRDGTDVVEGPHFPQPHKWYASVTLKNGIVVKVK